MTTVASCPGKVLLAGGYLVLDRQYRGFVVSTPSRFYTVVRNAANPTDATPSTSGEVDESFPIKVVSPQFDDGRWDFVAKREGGQWRIDPVVREG